LFVIIIHSIDCSFALRMEFVLFMESISITMIIIFLILLRKLNGYIEIFLNSYACMNPVCKNTENIIHFINRDRSLGLAVILQEPKEANQVVKLASNSHQIALVISIHLDYKCSTIIISCFMCRLARETQIFSFHLVCMNI
jgi:hypothetical protein